METETTDLTAPLLVAALIFFSMGIGACIGETRAAEKFSESAKQLQAE